MKIGILTYHRSHNYGACLQAYALANWIKQETEHDAEIIDYNSLKAEKYYLRLVFKGKTASRKFSDLKKYIMFNTKAMHGMPISSKKLVTDNLEKFARFVESKYDLIVVGSDEVWRLGFRGFPNPYFLPNVKGVKKLAYAVSARCDFDKMPKENQDKLRTYAADFEYIGVRDTATKDSLQPFSKVDIHLNCDPTYNYNFNPSKPEAIKVFNKHGISADKKIIAFMIGDAKIAEKIMKNLGERYVYISLAEQIPGTIDMCAITPRQWVDVISNVDFLVTSYFHGMCFAIKGNVPFVSIELRKDSRKNYSKSYDLLTESGLEERFYMPESFDVEEVCHRIRKESETRIDFNGVVILQKEKSKHFIEMLKGLRC